MVKADTKHDYYADLEIPVSADADTIKKQFRLLAKQYHPDRNPGRESEVVAKFQAVQAAHEILSDPLQKSKYDASRAQFLKKQEPDPYTFRRSQTTKAPPTNPFFQPPPRSRNPSVDRSQFTHTQPQPASGSAEKFAPFTRVPPSWDRAKFEEAASRAEAWRNFQSMRGQQQSQPQPPPKPARAPTAPRAGSTATSPDYTYPGGISPGFPGMSRTHDAPRKQGFSPATPGSDEPPAKSAYAYVNSNRDKFPPSAYQYSDSSQQPPSNPTSPTSQRAYPAGSPLKTSHHVDGNDTQRPVLGRTPSRYATSSGERTNLGAGLTRSSSVRNAPNRPLYGEVRPSGMRAQSSQEFPPHPPPRHRSASPKVRPKEQAGLEFSGTDTSSSEDESAGLHNRPKVVPRSSRKEQNPRSISNDPALTGHFSDKNYTRIVDDSQYAYPPPESRDAPIRRPFETFPSSVDDITEGLNASGMRNPPVDSPKTSYASPHVNGSTQDGHGRSQHPASFSASDWDGKFSHEQNYFVPSERDRKSPTKSSRSRPPQRGRQPTVEGDDSSSDTSSTTRKPQPPRADHSNSKGTGFQRPTFSADEWAQGMQTHNVGAGSAQRSPRPRFPRASVENDLEAQTSAVDDSEDAMDVDSSGPNQVPSIPTIRVNPVPQKDLEPGIFSASSTNSPRNSYGGVKLSDLAEASPLKSAGSGLSSLAEDLNSSLPFKSRAADQVQVTERLGATLKGLNLPKPPPPVNPPEKLTQASWENYWKKMQKYMTEWNEFNFKMIEVFRIRQEKISSSMYRNWVMGEGEGIDAEDVAESERPDSSGTGSNERSNAKGGYSTYMQWLKQDALCRRRWDLAMEEHEECLKGLGEKRREVKALRDAMQ